MATRVHNPAISYRPHLRLAFGGTLGTPPIEIWSNTLRFIPGTNTDPTPDNLQAVADAVAPTLSTWVKNGAALIGNSVGLVYVKATFVQASGLQRDANTAVHDYAPVVYGTSGSNPQWFQTYVLTLRTNFRRGLGHAGRIYPPVAGGVPAAGTPYCTAAEADGMANAFATCLQTMHDQITQIISPGSETGGFAIVSAGDSRPSAAHPNGHASVANYISGVECDRVADVMHSRTNRVPRVAPAIRPVVQGAAIGAAAPYPLP